MTGRNHAELIPRVIAEQARAEVQSRPVAVLATLRSVEPSGRRGRIEVLSEPDVVLDSVPLAMPYADEGTGDVLPLTPGVTGVALVLDHAPSPLLADGTSDHVDQGMDIEDAIFLPACVTRDDADAPAHDRGDRVWQHEGNRIEMRGDGTFRLEGDHGGFLEFDAIEEDVGDEPDEELAAIGMTSESTVPEVNRQPDEEPEPPDNTTWPIANDGESYGRVGHSGGFLTSTERGVAIEDAEVIADAPLNEAERIELAARYGHFHLSSHHAPDPVTRTGDGTQMVYSWPHNYIEAPDSVTVTPYSEAAAADFWVQTTASEIEVHYVSAPPDGAALEWTWSIEDGYTLTKEPLSFREVVAWMTDDTRLAQLQNEEDHTTAQTYFQNYLEWLEGEVGRTIDPTDPADWPEPEPMPTPEERASFEP